MTVGGPGTYPTVAAAALGATEALHAKIAGLVETLRDVVWGVPLVMRGSAIGFVGRVAAADIIGIEMAGSDPGVETTGPSRSEQHNVHVQVSVAAFRVTDDVAVTDERAWSILSAIDEHVRRTDPALGGAVLWARVKGTDTGSDTKTSNGVSGRLSVVVATVECRVIAAIR